MGIIGVVAALTLPNLNSSTGDKEKVVKVKKIYQNLQDAMGRAQAVYGPVDEWFVNDNNSTAQTTRFGERLTEFLKVSKNCKMTKGCYTSGSGNSSEYEFILADGTSVSTYSSDRYYRILIDIDGLNKGTNHQGVDQFYFVNDSADMSVIRPIFYDNPWPSTFGITSCLNTGHDGCTYWVIMYDNMDYLKTDSNGKCKNNSSITLNALANPPVISCK